MQPIGGLVWCLFSKFLKFFCILLDFFPLIGFIPSFRGTPNLWVISSLVFALLFIGCISGVWFSKPILILLWLGVFRFIFFIKWSFPNQVTMFMTPSTSEGDMFIIYVLDPFLILEFEAYGFWVCSRHIHLYENSCVGCISPF